MERGDGYVFLRGSIWWCKFYLNGKRQVEACRTKDGSKATDEQAARRYLKDRIKEKNASEVTGCAFVTKAMRKQTIDNLVDGLETHFEQNGKLSATNKSELKRVKEAFGHHRAVGLNAGHIDAYIEEQLAQDYARATINRTLTFLIRCFTLAKDRGTAPDVPTIKLLSLSGQHSNARQGFKSRGDFDKIHAHLPEDLKDFCLFSFTTAWRKGEVSGLEWKSVHDGRITLDATQTKNGKARSVAVAGELTAIIERRQSARLTSTGELSRLVFHRDGAAIVEFRKAWATACRKAGFPGTLFHDLRRSGVRNLIRSGVPQNIAMKISGHKTIAMFNRYDICNEDDLAAAMESVQRYSEAQAPSSNVVSIAK